MASRQAEPTTSPADESGSSKPGSRTRMTQFVAQWWPVLFTGAAATVLASFLYVATVIALTQGRFDYVAGFAAFGLLINSFPPAIVWASMKWIR